MPVQILLIILLCLVLNSAMASTSPVRFLSSVQLKKNISFTLLIPREDPFWQKNTEFAKIMAKSLDIRLKVKAFQDDPQKLFNLTEEACREGTDGIIFQSFENTGEKLLEVTEKYKVPSFLINTPLLKADFLPRSKYRYWLGQMIPDDLKAGTTLIQQLMDQARKGRVHSHHILAITGDPNQEASINRQKGLEKYLKYARDVKSLTIVHADWDPKKAVAKFKEQIKQNPQINIIWCANDNMALAVAEAAEKEMPGKQFYIGGIDWEARAIKAIGEKKLAVSVGGHFAEAAWAILLLYDYLNGMDFATEQISFHSPMIAINQNNYLLFTDLMSLKPDEMDFRPLSKIHNSKRTGYEFNLQKLATNLEDFTQAAAKNFSLTPREKNFLKAHPQISLGVMDAWPPMNFMDKEGSPSGIGADYIKALNKLLGGVLKITPAPFAQNLSQVKDKKLDALMDVTPKPEREEFLNFTRPYLTIPHVIVAKRDGPYYAAEEDLANKTLALEKGFYSVKYFRDKDPTLTIKEYPNTALALDAVARGSADAYAGNRAVATWIMDNEIMQNLMVQGRIKRPGSVLAIGVRKDWPELATILDKALAALPVDQIREVQRRWTGQEGKQWESLSSQLSQSETVFLKKHPDLRLGVTSAWAPYSYLDQEQKHAGVASDYLRIIAKKLGITLTPITGLSNEQTLKQIKKGEIDIIPTIMPGPDHAEFLDFTKPYLRLPLLVITRKDAPYISSLSGLKKKDIAMIRGHTPQKRLAEDLPGLNYLWFDNLEEAFRAVSEGRTFAIVETLDALNFAKNILEIENLKIATPTDYSIEIAMGVRKNLPLLATILDKGLSQFTDREKSIIKEKWGNIRVQKRTDWQMVVIAVVLTGMGVGIVLLVFFWWNRKLAGEVAQRKAAEERFKTMAANVPGAIFQTKIMQNCELEHLYLSQKTKDFFGFDAEEVLQKKLLLKFHPEDQKRIKREFQYALTHKNIINIVGRIVLPDGTEKWIRLSASPSYSEQHGLIYNGFILDISKRKNAEHEYLASERKINAMSRAVEDALIMIDDHGKVLFWNPAAENLFGYTQEEAMGLNVHSLTAPPHYKEQIQAGFKRFAMTGEGNVLGKTVEIEASNRKGILFPVEVTLSSFQFDDKWYAVGTVRDISERKQAEKELKQSREDFRIIADYTYNWEAWHDREGRLLWMNPAVKRVTGYTKEECLQMPDFPKPIIHPSDFKLWGKCLVQAQEQNQGSDKIFRIITKEGEERWASLSWNPVFDQEKHFTGFRTSVEDITYRKLAEDQLKFTQYTVDMAVQSIFWVDPISGKIVYVNDAASISLGYSKKKLLELKISQIDPSYEGENFAQLVSSLRRKKVLNIQSKHLAKNGSTLDVELSLCLLTHNQRQVIIVFAKDVTEQKEAERMLKESQGRLDMALTASNTGLWDWYPEKDIHYHSDQYFMQLGYNRGDFQGVQNPLLEMMHPEDIIRFEKGMEIYTSGQSNNYNQEFRLRAKDGSYRWILSRGRVMQRDPQGKILRILGVHLDITKRKKAEQELKENLEELERFSRLVVGREEKMINLKQEINSLLNNLDQEPKYKIVN